MASLGGSFYSDDIADYYLTPCDLGYGAFVKFDHEFVGPRSFEKMADRQKRKKGDARLEWRRCRACLQILVQMTAGISSKYIDLPLANYSTLPLRQGLEYWQDS